MAGGRFYLPFYRDEIERPVWFEDLGSLLKISGVVIQGMGSTMVLLSRQMEVDPSEVVYVQPSLEEWGRIITQTDNAEFFVGEEGGVNKVLHRKQLFALSGEVQQKIWARDDFKCVYCGVPMGKALMTVDHFIPLEQGGDNNERNYLTACRKCNKGKGMMMPEKFCQMRGFDFTRIKKYLDDFNR